MNHLWYEAGNVYGKLRGWSGISVLAWANDPNHYVVGMSISGSSSAVKGAIAKVRIGEGATFIPTEENTTFYGKSKVDIRGVGTHLYRYEAFPKSPLALPDGSVTQMITRIEEAKISKFICYVDNGKADESFLDAVKTVTDYPVHDDWAKWLKDEAARRSCWGSCHGEAPRASRYSDPQIDGAHSFSPSKYGLQYRWVRNSRELWEDMIVKGLKFHKIHFPKRDEEVESGKA